MHRLPQILIFIFLFSLSGCWHHPLEELNWQTYKLNETGISIELPYPLEVKKVDQKRNDGVFLKVITGLSKQPYDYSIFGIFKRGLKRITGAEPKPIFFTFDTFVHDEQVDKKGNNYNLKEITDRNVNSFYKIYKTKQNKNVTLTTEKFIRSGLSGVQITESCDDYDENGRFEYIHHGSFICLTKGRHLWRIIINYTTNEESANPKIAEATVQRIIQSFKIEAKNP